MPLRLIATSAGVKQDKATTVSADAEKLVSLVKAGLDPPTPLT